MNNQQRNYLEENILWILITVRYNEMFPVDLRFDTAEDIEYRHSKAMQLYNNDPIFYHRTKLIVSGIIQLIEIESVIWRLLIFPY